MPINSENRDTNLAFQKWRSSTGRVKECNLSVLIRQLEIYATAICWQKLPDHPGEFSSIVNEAVWRTLAYSDNFRGKSKFTTWFYRIVINICNTRLAEWQRLAETALQETMQAKVDMLDARLDLIAILDKLEDEDHQLFRLVAEGLSFREIGKILGIEYHAARKRWDRLKEKLRDAL